MIMIVQGPAYHKMTICLKKRQFVEIGSTKFGHIRILYLKELGYWSSMYQAALGKTHLLLMAGIV